MNFYGNRLNERFIFREVEFDTLQEGAEIEDITGGSLDFGAFTDLKVSGTLSFFGKKPDDSKLVRIYYSFTDDEGEDMEPACLATLFMQPRDIANAYTLDGIVEQGSVDLLSVLAAINGDIIGLPDTVLEGDNASNKAAADVRAHGLQVEKSKESAYVLPKDKLFDSSDTYAKKVNELLAAAGYRAAMPSERGKVSFQDSALPTTPAFVFKTGDDSIMQPNVTETNNWTDGFNCWKAYYADEEVSLYAEAIVTDGANNATSRIHRFKTDTLQLDSLAGADASAMLANLMAAVQTKAQDNTGAYEYVKLTHPWVPLKLYDCVTIEYGAKSWTGNVANMHLDLSTGASCETELRRPIKGAATIHVRGVNLLTGEEVEYDV